MPRHRNLNLKKFIDSIPDSLIEEYFGQKLKVKSVFLHISRESHR